jgi:hypothetical protein
MFRCFLLALCLLGVCASLVSAEEIHVPGDYPDLKTAVRWASAGDVILVSTGVIQDPVVIDKSLTILGDPVLKIGVKCGFDPICTLCPPADHGFRLEGPGAGRVVIGNAVSFHLDCFWPASVIGGGGFEELHVFNSTFSATIALSGVANGFSTIKVDVPHVLIDGSEVVGGKPDADDCYGDGHLPSEIYAAIEAPASEVTILSSRISGGGDSHFYCCMGGCTCPAELPSGGDGGHGVVANAVFVDSASVVTGGEGSTFFAKLSSSDPGVQCGTKPDGAAFVAGAVHPLPGAIAGSGVTPLGGTFTLTFNVPGPLAVLFVSPQIRAPVHIHGAGFSYLASPLFVGPIPSGAPQSLGFPVPPSAALLGLEGGFQIFDATLGLTAPAVCLLAP